MSDIFAGGWNFSKVMRPGFFLLSLFLSGSVLCGPVAAEKVTVVKNTAEKIVPDSREQIKFSYAPLVKALAPAVVNVYAARQVRQRQSPFSGDPFFERFFGRDMFRGRPRQRISRSLGSGVVVDGSGLVITNNHVIKDADEVKIALSDGREFEARIVLVDKASDLAVLKFEPDGKLAHVVLGDSESLEVGDLVLAIGNPFGVGQTVTSGIVSALARSQGGVNDFGFFIQTDASINPGNSGGALVDMSGALVGINTAIYSRSGGSNGIGFAVPSNMVRVVLESAKLGSETLMRPWVGAQFQEVSPDIADSLGMARPKGAMIAGVVADGPASKAGLKPGDIVLEVDGKPVPHMDALGYRLAIAGVGRTVSLLVLSRNEEKTLKIALDVAPEKPARDQRDIKGRSPFSGMRVANLSPRLVQELELPVEKRGVVITQVRDRSPAQRFGFRPGDIMVELNGAEIESTQQFEKLLRTRRRGWKFILDRNGRLLRKAIR